MQYWYICVINNRLYVVYALHLCQYDCSIDINKQINLNPSLYHEAPMTMLIPSFHGAERMRVINSSWIRLQS